ncbi:YbgC/FadM family acyl-CoA thioesterase [Phenylobacterium sp.]|jgi:acyl-CoA thioester hydrolase|uniref:YbgC/FadM family acyl-CoA thioesterase n=1 Tax=Phenylobacterium sp. TaxID=1871053 RepID=UPI002E364CD0|nr:YbgC/FadM family acyl-CoA thioesterase [Phenylobacterium sp.]HEX3367082.1 YbgC/FadM family acyl-CoA thioesterase [Phenylobacterium sp.]
MSEPSSGWLVGREHQLPVRIYYEDTDFTGVVYHANYLRYFERGRSDFFRVVGVSHSALLERPDPAAFTITHITVDFKRAARIDDALLVRTTYDSVRGPRLFISQRITRGEELIAAAQVEAACIDLKGRARKPPSGMAEALAPLFAESSNTDPP